MILLIFCILMLQQVYAVYQLSNETCRALDTMLASHSVPIGGGCVQTNCSVILCAKSIRHPVGTLRVLSFELLPCQRPFGVQAISFGLFLGTELNITITRSRNVPVSSLGTVNFVLNQILGGINFGVFVNSTELFLPLTDIPLQCPEITNTPTTITPRTITPRTITPRTITPRTITPRRPLPQPTARSAASTLSTSSVKMEAQTILVAILYILFKF